MRFVKNLAVLMILARPEYLFAAEGLKSPYFIDGVHCEGLEDSYRDEMFARQYRDDVVAKMGVKARNQTACERIYAEFGIEKFQWITPEDLERLSFGLKRSGRYKSVDIRIEKSELQNHVHLKGKFVQYDPEIYVTLNAHSGLEKGQSTGNRSTIDTDGLVEFNKRGRNNHSLGLGFRTKQSTAKEALSAEELKIGDRPIVMTEEEQAAQSKQSWQYREMFFKGPVNEGIGRFPIDLRIGFNTTKLAQDERGTSNVSVDMMSSYDADYYLPVKFGFFLKYATYNATGAEVVRKESKDDPSSKSKSKSIIFAGISEEFDTARVWGDVRFYRALSSEMHYFYSYDFGLRLTEFAGFDHSVGIASDAVYGAILPEHRFGLPNRDLTQIFYQGDSRFSLLGSENSLRIRAGMMSLSSTTSMKDEEFRRTAEFAEVGIKTRADNLDIGLSFIYGNQRLY